MLQQTTVAAARPYFERFAEVWPTVEALAAAQDDAVMSAWAGLGYYARARNLLACARAVAARGGFPDTEGELRALPGIGAYTAAAVASIAFGRRAVVVDGNVERVMARLHAVEAPLPGAKRTLWAHADALTPEERPGDHAQAVMDLGATICTPRRPACGICPWMERCAGRRAGLAETLPRKAPRKPRPERRGTLWIARRSDGAWLLERRPERGMLGGTLGWPGTAWETGEGGEPPIEAAWRPAGEIGHGFTHFTVVLQVQVAEVPRRTRPVRGRFMPAVAFDPAALPTLMRKAWRLAREADPQARTG
jgi:A/G-specific adenine glycosylase